MAEFCIEIAGVPIGVRSIFESTRDYCRNSLSQRTPQISISVTREDLIFEQQALDMEADEEGLRRRVFTDPFLERAAIQRQVAEHLIEQNVLLFHGSAVAADALGYVFTAKCGTGKSTHVRLWLQELGDRAQIINDDKPFLRLTDTEILVYGAPWSGKHGLENNICVPLQSICILERGSENRIAPEEGCAAADFLAHQCLAPRQEARQAHFFRLVRQLSEKAAVYRMACTPQAEAAQLAIVTMSPAE